MTSKTYVSFLAGSQMTLCLWRRPDSGDETSHPLGSPALHAGCVIGAWRTRVRLRPCCLASVQIRLRE